MKFRWEGSCDFDCGRSTGAVKVFERARAQRNMVNITDARKVVKPWEQSETVAMFTKVEAATEYTLVDGVTLPIFSSRSSRFQGPIASPSKNDYYSY
eukprot:1766713-Amphidinium_carterae.1